MLCILYFVVFIVAAVAFDDDEVPVMAVAVAFAVAFAVVFVVVVVVVVVVFVLVVMVVLFHSMQCNKTICRSIVKKKSEKYWGLRWNGWAGAVMAVRSLKA